MSNLHFGETIRVFSSLGDYPAWRKRISEPGITGFKADHPEECTDRWMENFAEVFSGALRAHLNTDEKRSGFSRTVFT